MDTNCDIVWDNYLACAYVEGFCEGENATIVEKLHAWAYIHKIGIWNTLQGWYGRTLHTFVDRGYINADSSINWELVNAVNEPND